MLATGTKSDYTLLMIEGVIPRNLYWAGWTAKAVPDGTASAAIHHPAGDYKRISFGKRAENPVCGGTNRDHVRINWISGPTEPGSSGGGLFRSDTHQLYGQLHCGPSSCDSVSNDSFGAFSATYPKIARFLAAGSDDFFEDNNTCETARGLGPSTYPGLVVTGMRPDWYRIKVPVGQTLTVTLTFNGDWGALGARLYRACSLDPTMVATEAGNTLTLTVTNTEPQDAMYRWLVYLQNDTRNTYTMKVELH
jgi:hypothetical protein